MFSVVTYNIRSGLGLDRIRSIRRVADVLAALSPHVVCLQEVDQRVRRSWLSNQPKFLSTRLGMHAVFQRNISSGAGGYGNCVLLRPHVTHCRCYKLPGDGEPRGVLEVTTSLDDREVVILCTHLSTDAEERVRQAQRVLEIASEIRRPKILCGDVNDEPGSRAMEILLSGPVLTDCASRAGEREATFDSASPSRRIDYILADRRFSVLSCRTVASEASDHRPVVAELALG